MIQKLFYNAAIKTFKQKIWKTQKGLEKEEEKRGKNGLIWNVMTLKKVFGIWGERNI